jgi:hypothetical protein
LVLLDFGVGYGNSIYAWICIGGDSSPASVHGSPLKRTRPESDLSDLHVLSRGFIPGETNRNFRYRNPTYFMLIIFVGQDSNPTIDVVGANVG